MRWSTSADESSNVVHHGEVLGETGFGVVAIEFGRYIVVVVSRRGPPNDKSATLDHFNSRVDRRCAAIVPNTSFLPLLLLLLHFLSRFLELRFDRVRAHPRLGILHPRHGDLVGRDATIPRRNVCACPFFHELEGTTAECLDLGFAFHPRYELER